jgi:hypothetical protein
MSERLQQYLAVVDKFSKVPNEQGIVCSDILDNNNNKICALAARQHDITVVANTESAITLRMDLCVRPIKPTYD